MLAETRILLLCVYNVAARHSALFSTVAIHRTIDTQQ